MNDESLPVPGNQEADMERPLYEAYALLSRGLTSMRDERSQSREKSLAMTKAEECLFWLSKAL